MSAYNAFSYAAGLFLVLALLFNVIYFFVVLPRVRSAGKDVGFAAFINIYQSRYVKMYWEVLAEQEKRKWYNLAIKHSLLIAWFIWGVSVVFLLYAQE